MTRLIETLAEFAAPYEALLCDLWGCVHDGLAPFPDAVAALKTFRGAGGRVVLLTNAPRPHGAVRASLDAMGLSPDAYDAVVSSGDAAQEAMLRGAVGRRVHHIGPEKDEAFFDDIPAALRDLPAVERVALDRAEGIVCTGPFDEKTETPQDYRATFLMAKQRGLKLLCANPDLVVDYGDRRIYCAGALAQLYEEMGGESLYYGKPHPPIYDMARRALAASGGPVDDDRLLAVGDGIATDIAGGMAEGIDTLFVTGGLSWEAFGPDRDHPDPALLEAWLEVREISPTAATGRLR